MADEFPDDVSDVSSHVRRPPTSCPHRVSCHSGLIVAPLHVDDRSNVLRQASGVSDHYSDAGTLDSNGAVVYAVDKAKQIEEARLRRIKARAIRRARYVGLP